MEGAIAELADTAWHYASDEELLVAAQDIEKWARQLYGISLAVTAELDTRGVATARGATSTPVLLRQLLRIAPGEAQRRVRDARAVCPRVQITARSASRSCPPRRPRWPPGS